MLVSITLLQYEHGIIRQVIDCLKVILENGLPVKHNDSTMDILEFLNDYMDRFHHQKEERFVFPSAFTNSGELETITNNLLNDHEKARALLSRMNASVDKGSIIEMEEFIEAGLDLVKHVTDHITQEEDVAFPLFEEVISIEDDGTIAEKFQDFVLMEFNEEYPRVSEEKAFRIENQVLGPGYYQGIV